MEYSQAHFTKLYNDHYSLVLMIVSKYVHGEDVEDLVQDIFLKAFQNYDKYNSEFKFSTWIANIAKNHAIDYIRTSKAMKIIPSGCIIDFNIYSDDRDQGNSTFELNFLNSKFHSYEDEPFKNEKINLIFEYIETKPLKQKVIFKTYLYGFRLKEICEIVDENINFVKQIIFRMKNELREVYV